MAQKVGKGELKWSQLSGAESRYKSQAWDGVPMCNLGPAEHNILGLGQVHQADSSPAECRTWEEKDV